MVNLRAGEIVTKLLQGIVICTRVLNLHKGGESIPNVSREGVHDIIHLILHKTADLQRPKGHPTSLRLVK